MLHSCFNDIKKIYYSLRMATVVSSLSLSPYRFIFCAKELKTFFMYEYMNDRLFSADKPIVVVCSRVNPVTTADQTV